jgi:hypothetical protein
LSISEGNRYIISRKLLDSIFNKLPVFFFYLQPDLGNKFPLTGTDLPNILCLHYSRNGVERLHISQEDGTVITQHACFSAQLIIILNYLPLR